MKKIFTILLASFFVVACGSGSDEGAANEPEMAPEQTSEPRREVRRERQEEPAPLPPRTGDPARNIPRVQGSATEAGYGLTMIVDGSSPEAFQQSLELMAMDATEQQYRQLDTALRFLRMYSSDGWGSTADFYRSLDGLSGEEIILRANEQRARAAQRRH